MRLCVLVGSSRTQGISRQVCSLIAQYVDGRVQCEFVYLVNHRIELCDADNLCATKPCQLADDMPDIIAKMLSADGIIYMPVMHAYGTNSRFQTFLERAGYGFLRPLNRPLKDKVVGIVVVGRRYAHTAVYSQIMLNAMLNKMILVGSGFPAIFFGMLGSAVTDLEAIDSLHSMLDRMLEISEQLRRGKLQCDSIFA